MNNNLKLFYWVGINDQGQKTQGNINARNKKNAVQILKDNDIVPLKIHAQYFLLTHKKKPHSAKEQLYFIGSLYDLLKSDLSLSDALLELSKCYKNLVIKKIIYIIQKRVLSGSSFSDALSNNVNLLNNTQIRLIKIGEQNDCLLEILNQLHNHLKKQLQLKSKLIKAASYPLIILAITLIICLGLLIFVIPQFQNIYQQFNAQLPVATLILINISHLLSGHFLLILNALCLIISIGIYIRKNFASIRIYEQKLMLKLPICRHIIQTALTAKWSQTLSLLLHSGVQLLEALRLLNQTIQFYPLNQTIKQWISQIDAGQSLSNACQQSALIPQRAKQLIAIAEQTDDLETAIEKIALIYQEKCDQALEHLSKFAEPVIMIVVATVIAFLIITMYLPIFRMGNII